MRDKETHLQQCTLLLQDPSGEISKEHGINCNSILNELMYFHTCDGSLLPDTLHDVLEGALQNEVKLMLQYMVEELCTPEDLKSWLENLDPGYMESKDRPTSISRATLYSSGSSLRQKGITCDHICKLPTILVPNAFLMDVLPHPE